MKHSLRIYDRLIEGLVSLAGMAMGGVCLLIAWDVIARNVGLEPPASTVALTEYALLYVTMAAAPWLVRTRGHVVIEILHQRLGGALRRWLDRATCLLCAAIAFVVAGFAVVLAAEAVARGELDVRSLDIPRAWLFAPLAVGFTLMGTEFLRLLVRGETLAAPETKRSVL